MSNYNTQLQTHNTDLQAVLQNLKTKASGIKLPELTNPATESEVVAGYEFINEQGVKITGTNPYEKDATDSTVAEQADLITQIKNAANNLPEAGNSGSGSIETVVGTIKTMLPTPPGEEPQLGSTVYYIDGNGSLQNTSAPGTISVMKNSIIVSHSGSSSYPDISGNAVRICYITATMYAFYVLGDFTIIVK